MKTRPLTDDDLEPVAELLREDEEHLTGRASRIAANDVREWLSRTDLANDTILYEDGDTPAAVGWLDVPPGHDAAIALGVVRPGYKGRGIGAELAARNEQRAEGRAQRIHAIALGGDAAAGALLTSRGYREVRRFYDMAIEQTEPPPPVDVVVEQVTEATVREFHDCLDEAFQDHWEHVSSTFEEWWGRHSQNPNLDLSLWYLIRENGEAAAVTRNEANRNGGGYIGAIGVRREHRGKGYAKALLLHSFREFYERGLPRVTLGVDAQNPTGATHLYERVGMHVELENVVYEKRLAS